MRNIIFEDFDYRVSKIADEKGNDAAKNKTFDLIITKDTC